jgi:hypothetical protein
MLPAGAEAMLQVDAPGLNFMEGSVSVGFAAGDVAIRRVWVVSPTRLLANVAVSALAFPGPAAVTITSGMQVVTQQAGLEVQPSNPRLFWLSSTLLDAVTKLPLDALRGGTLAAITVGGAGAPVTGVGTFVWIGDRQTPVLAVTGNQILFQVPGGLTPGPVPLRVESPSDRSLSIVVMLESPLPRALATVE